MLIRKDLPHSTQVVQASHACIEATKAFLTDQEIDHPHLVVLGVNSQEQLHNSAKKLEKAGIRFRVFIEPDRDNESTALATEPISGETRRIFKNYKCLGNNHEIIKN